jgi:hypothetical protein
MEDIDKKKFKRKRNILDIATKHNNNIKGKIN